MVGFGVSASLSPCLHCCSFVIPVIGCYYSNLCKVSCCLPEWHSVVPFRCLMKGFGLPLCELAAAWLPVVWISCLSVTAVSTWISLLPVRGSAESSGSVNTLVSAQVYGMSVPVPVDQLCVPVPGSAVCPDASCVSQRLDQLPSQCLDQLPVPVPGPVPGSAVCPSAWNSSSFSLSISQLSSGLVIITMHSQSQAPAYCHKNCYFGARMDACAFCRLP